MNLKGRRITDECVDQGLWVGRLGKQWKQSCKKSVCSRFSHVWLFATLWTATHQALLSIGFSKKEYRSELSCPPPGDLPNPGMELISLMSPTVAGVFFTTEPPGKLVKRQRKSWIKATAGICAGASGVLCLQHTAIHQLSSNYSRSLDFSSSFKVLGDRPRSGHVYVCSLSCVSLFSTPVNCSLPGSSVRGIFPARILESVAPPPRIFPTQGLNPCLLHWQLDSLSLRLLRSPSGHVSILKWSAVVVVFDNLM